MRVSQSRKSRNGLRLGTIRESKICLMLCRSFAAFHSISMAMCVSATVPLDDEKTLTCVQRAISQLSSNTHGGVSLACRTCSHVHNEPCVKYSCSTFVSL